MSPVSVLVIRTQQTGELLAVLAVNIHFDLMQRAQHVLGLGIPETETVIVLFMCRIPQLHSKAELKVK